jgi:hypothetical protein
VQEGELALEVLRRRLEVGERLVDPAFAASSAGSSRQGSRCGR